MAGSNNKVLPPPLVAIVFDRPDAIYRAGEILAGWIDLNLKNDIRVKAMKLHVQGQARVSWDEKRTYTKGVSPTISHKQSDVILDHQVYLVKKDGNNCSGIHGHAPMKKTHRRSLCFPLVASSEEPEGVIIAAGPHRFSFEYILPRNLPSSFEGKWGQIFYGVRFSMERPWKATLDRDRTFTVDSVVDFNDEPEIMRPIYGSGEFSMMDCCFSGEVYVQMRVARKGFVRGDTATVHVEIYNNSMRVMRDSRVSLVQHAIFRAGSRIKKTSTPLRTITQGEVHPDQCKVFDAKIEIPPDVVPSSLRNDDWRGISVRYTCSVTLTPSSWWSSPWVLPVQIVVGTIALRRETARRYLSQLMTAAAGAGSSNSLPVTPAKKRPDDSRDQDDASGPFLVSPGDVTPNINDRVGDASIPPSLTRGGFESSSERRFVKGRQSVPCFSATTPFLASNIPVKGHSKERRASAFELGALPKQSNASQKGGLLNARSLDRTTAKLLSNSLETMALSNKNSNAKQRLKSVSEEESSDRTTTLTTSKDSSCALFESMSTQIDDDQG